MKIFVSHAAVDHALANQFVNLLYEGTGFAKTDIFCSSIAGSIPTGEEFVQIILQHLAEAGMVVLLISSPFLQSQFCLAETGAAQMRKQSGSLERIFPLVIPPAKLDDLKGFLLGSQAALITDQTALGSIRRGGLKSGSFGGDESTVSTTASSVSQTHAYGEAIWALIASF